MALWRETLLAKKVLEGNTRGYKNHPQLLRFRNSEDPRAAINLYLSYILEEASNRNYIFNRDKIEWELCSEDCPLIQVTSGQMEYESEHLLSKLKVREPRKFLDVITLRPFLPHPLFEIIPGGVEDWEVVVK